MLRFPLSFFYGPDLDQPSPELVVSKRQRLNASIRDAALAAGAIGFLISDWVDVRFICQLNLPDLHLYDPETAARTLRQEWGLGEQPFDLHSSLGIEACGCLLAENSTKVNAFSLWRNEKPYVF